MTIEAHYRMPAEWEPHTGTWFSWPHNPETWPGRLERVEQAMVQAVAALAEGEIVHLNVLDAAHRAHVHALLRGRCAPERVRIHEVPTNDAWCRDHGAIFVTATGGAESPARALHFRFNSWGGKYPPFDLDDTVPAHMARILGLPERPIDIVLEGGSIDVNGAGTLITTEQCLLNPNRNPQLSRGEIEAVLRAELGVERIVWLADGIVGDDTDGHVDDITRFVAEDRVLTMVEPDPADPNHRPLAENLERLERARLPDGRALSVVELPMPEPVTSEGVRLPASYANFYVGNAVVLLPVFGGARDHLAIDVVASCFPGRRVVPIDSREVVFGLGAWHCLSQQVPAF